MKLITTQALDSVLGFLHNVQSAVFWVCLPRYEQILFLSQSYEGIWGRTRHSLQDHPSSWAATLIPADNVPMQHAIFQQRPEYEGAHIAHYRVMTPSQKLRFKISIRDSEENMVLRQD